MKITILGCGSSGGVPLITGKWGECSPNNSRNYRTRCSVALDIKDQTWLIDTSPDLRFQCLREGISAVDGVIYTHAHFDHIGGLDDLKPFSIEQKTLIPIWADPITLQWLKIRHSYAFQDSNPEALPSYAPFLQGNVIEEAFSIGDVPVIPFIQDHRYSQSLGFRFPSWAYSTDVWALDEVAFSILEGVDLWIVACMARYPVTTHAHLERILEWIEHVKPTRVVLTHMGHSLDYDELQKELPSHVMPAYDGMVLETAD